MFINIERDERFQYCRIIYCDSLEWCHISRNLEMRANLPQEMPHLPREMHIPALTSTSPAGDAASPNCGTCDTAGSVSDQLVFDIIKL